MARNIIAIVDDLFFASKIRGTADQLGVSVSFPRTIESAVSAVAQESPALLICDLNSQRIDPIEFAQTMNANDQTRQIDFLGFFSNEQTDLKRAAQQAVIHRLISCSALG